MILIFKTNLSCTASADKVIEKIKQNHVCNQVTVDLDDCDKVLRVDGDVPMAAVIAYVEQQGFSCTEL